ncbi:von Willebrand factor type A domain-containing protein [Actinomycetota bacterium]
MRNHQYLIGAAVVVALLASACADSADEDRSPLTTIAGDSRRSSNTTAAPATTAAPGGGRQPIAGGSADASVASTTTAAALTEEGLSVRADVRDEFYREREPINDFVDPSEDDLSTFAVDVDTGAYTIMRAQLDNGRLPDPSTVRVEEFVNYFDPGYAAPDGGTFAVYADGGPTPFAQSRYHEVVRIGIKAREVANRQRKDLNLTLVIDVSGSMKEDGKLEIVKDALEVLVDELDRADRVSIVAYTDEAWVALDATDGGDKDRILSALSELEPLRTTNAEAGLILGYDMADSIYERDTQNRVILLSDGVANVGRTGPESILARISDETSRGIDLVTIGVGIDNYNDTLLEQLADQGDGFYAYVDTREEAERLFRDELTSTLETVARDVKVQVRFDPQVVAEYRLLGFENRDIRDDDFRDDSVDAGEIGAGHTVVALYEVELDEEAYGRRAPAFAEVSLRWEDADTGRVDEISGEVFADSLATSFGRTEPEFQLAATVAAYAEVLRGSRYMRGISLDEIADVANELPLRELSSDADEFIDLVERAEKIDH